MISEFHLRNFFALLILTSLIADLVIGGLVLADSPRRKINRLFATLAFALALCGVSLVAFNLTQGSTSLFWSRLCSSSSIFIPPLFFHLVLGSLGSSLKHIYPNRQYLFERGKQLAYVSSSG